jgi:hypothetical protein
MTTEDLVVMTGFSVGRRHRNLSYLVTVQLF